jgi:hypothetical protein
MQESLLAREHREAIFFLGQEVLSSRELEQCGQTTLAAKAKNRPFIRVEASGGAAFWRLSQEKYEKNHGPNDPSAHGQCNSTPPPYPSSD